MVLRTLLIPKGQNKGDEEKKNSSTQVYKGRRERVPHNSMKLFGVSFELSRVLYLYRYFVTVLANIATTITLMDKIRIKFIH